MGHYLLLTIAHVVGAAVGVGAATASDTTFMRAIRNRSVSRDQLVIIRSVSRVVLVGLALVVLTGVNLLIHNPSILQQGFFQAKMVIAFILVMNGFVFHTFIERFLEEHIERELTQELLGHRVWVFALDGTVSIVSWYAPLLLILAGRPALACGLISASTLRLSSSALSLPTSCSPTASLPRCRNRRSTMSAAAEIIPARAGPRRRHWSLEVHRIP